VRSGLVVALLMAMQGLSLAVRAEPLPTAEPPQNAAVRQTYTLDVTKDGITSISLDAQGAKLSDIAADLSRRLGVRIIVGPTLVDETIWATLVSASLESALGALAPRPYIDYEFRQDAEPAPREIYLLGSAEPEPAIRGSAQGLLITGHTEDGSRSSAPDPLRVLYDNNRLTLSSKQQPLAVVVTAIADMLNVPAEIQYDAIEIVDTEIRDAPPEQALVRLSPNIRVTVRVDVYWGKQTVRRIVVTRTAAR
jgi:hypothetical protein